ncbi:MAG TPA: methyltransferase domain-containing protein [Candidatus Acidoferrales bacterium]
MLMFFAPEAYEKQMGRWSRRLAPLLVEFAQVQDGDRVLDVGTGIGSVALTAAAGSNAAGIVGLDPATPYVQYAQRRSPDRRLRFAAGDAQQLPFRQHSFDVCLSCLVLNFIPDAARAVGEMRRVIRPGGVVAACVWEYGGGMEMLRTFWDAVVALDPAAEPRDERHMPYCRPGELAALWKAAGFEQVEEAPLTIDMTFASFEDYWQPFTMGQAPSGSYVFSLSPDGRARLQARLREELMRSQPSGELTLQGRALGVRGRVPPR